MLKNTAGRLPWAALGMAGLLASALGSPRAAKADPFSQHDQPAEIAEFDPGMLSVVDRDTQNRVMRETGVTKAGNKVERVTRRDPAGDKLEQSTTVLSPLPGRHPLSLLDKAWTRSGKLKSIQNDVYTLDATGSLTGGRRKTEKFKDNRVVNEVDESWSPDIHGWLVTAYTSISYYPDGDMRKRVTDNPATGQKTEETWGLQGKAGRSKHVRHWTAVKNG